MPRTMLSAALLLAVLPNAAPAAVIPVTFEGTITSVDASIASGFTVGATVTGSFELDTESPDLEPLPDEGDYDGLANLSVDFGDYTATAADASLHMRNGEGAFVDNFYVSAEPLGPDVGGFPLTSFYLNLGDEDNTVFSSEAIPATLSLGDFEIANAVLFFQEGNVLHGVDVSITELQYGAPEPSQMILAAIGALVLAASARVRSAYA